MNKSRTRKPISRRGFIGRAAAGTAGIAFGPVLALTGSELQNSKWPAGARKYRFHLIGHAHIDPVWLWPWPEGMAVVHSTFRSALDRMNETPGFAFTASSAQFYEWVAENDPEMLKEIRKRVEEGRWNVVGGWWVEPDMNIPGGEAMVRQGLYGQLTLERLLGVRSKVAFNPDSFGHTATLPQIISKQGMENYVFMRPGPREKTIEADLFWWESPDGTRVLTYRIPISYNDSRSVRNRIEQVMTQLKDQPFTTFMSYYGAGDHGGGATKENIASILEIQSEKDAPLLLFSTPGAFFNEVRGDRSLSLPVIKDDLQHHAVGCYTAEAEIKKNNRLAEAALIAAEKICAIGSVAWKCSYPKTDFSAAWKRVLFLQFHDSLAGTSVPEHSVSAREGYGFALDTARQALYKSVQKLEWQVPAEDPASQYLIAFNPNSWEITGNIEYDFNRDLKNPSVLEDEKGNHLPHQWFAGTTETGSRRGLVIRTHLPAMGYRQLRIYQGNADNNRQPVKTGEKSIENEFLKLTFSENGEAGITDKASGREWFAGGATGCRAVVIDDPSDTWSHDIKAFDNETGSFGKASIRITEDGPLRAVARVRSYYGNSDLTIDWILYSGARQIEIRVTLNWHEKLKMLKFSFPVNIESPVATWETSYGFIERNPTGDEEPGQRWIDVTGRVNGGTAGLSVINDAKYGYSIKGADMRVSVIRSAVFAHHNPRVLDMNAEHIWQDQGIHTFRMLVAPHQGSWKESGIVRLAEEFLSPPVSIYQGIHGGRLPKSGSYLAADSSSVIVTSVKQAETDEDIILRCVETHGTDCSATIDIRFAGLKWSGSFKPCEIKSLRLHKATGEIREVNLLEE